MAIFAVLLVWLLAAGSAIASDDASRDRSSDATATPPVLMLGVGDAIRVRVAGADGLSTEAYIDDDGSVPVPLAGKVEVAGSSPSEAAGRIAAAFRRQQLLVDPQVTVFLVESRSQKVSVLGAVRSPGRFTIQSNSTLLDVLAQAGGISADGGDEVVVLRSDGNGDLARHRVNLQGLADQNGMPPTLLLRGGDSVFVPEAERFSIYGEVNSPDSYPLEPGMTVVEAISRGGGITPRGSRNRIEVRRARGDGEYVTHSVSLEDEVKPDDVIRVKGRWF